MKSKQTAEKGEVENKLQLIVQESGLEKTKSQRLLDQFTNYFEIASEWEKKARTIVVKDENDKTEMQMARVGRLFLRDKRIAIEKVRVELKEQALREGKAIDGIANVLKALIVPIEEYLGTQEKFIEIKAQAEAEERRIEEEKRIEAESLAKEEADRKEQERIRLENIKLMKEAEVRDKKMEDAERLARAEKEKADKLIAMEKAKAEKVRVEAERLANIEREKLDAERAERDRVQKLLDEQVECPFCHKKFNLTKD